MKKPIKIRNWYFQGDRLCGDVTDHPTLGSTEGKWTLVTSKIKFVETQNNLYELDGDGRTNLHASSTMAVREPNG